MPEKKLTFQTVMRWSDEQCREFLVAMRWPDGIRCPKCGSQKEPVFLARAGMLNPALFQTHQSNISRLLP